MEWEIKLYLTAQQAQQAECRALQAQLEEQGREAEQVIIADGMEITEPEAAALMTMIGEQALPLLVIGGEAVISGRWPEPQELSIWLGTPTGGCGGCPSAGCENCAGCPLAEEQ